MAYFGGKGITGRVHPSIKAYIECFMSPPFPKMFPRGGGIWDQDPILMRDFRIIRKFDHEWKEGQQKMDNAMSDASFGKQGNPGAGGGGLGGLDNALSEYIDSLEEDGFY